MGNKLQLLIISFSLIVILAGCQSTNESNNAEKDNPNIAETEISYIQDGEELEATLISECLPDDECTRESSFLSRDSLNMVEKTEGIESVKAESSEPIHIDVTGMEPTQISYHTHYVREKGGRVSSDSGIIEQKEMMLGGEGTKRIFVDILWENDQGEFIGAKREALVINF